MEANQEKTSINVVDLGSSDDDEDQGSRRRESKKSTKPPISPTQQTSNRTLESRSFWKAGACDVGFAKSNFEQGQLEHARVHPKFLHSNATSHKWAFGAIAELLDNAVDEICKGATYVMLDKISNSRDHTPALLFQDDGGGMDPGSMRQCMSLGYSKKKGDTIGQYGNGFKTSTMRLGADVIVFSRTTHGSCATQGIGLLSYTFLRKTGQDDVIVPMIDYELSGDRMVPIIYGSLDEWNVNLGIILEWSPFTSEQELMLQFEDIGPHGTKVIVYNLWLNDDGLLELDFDYDEEDIRLRDEVDHEKTQRKKDILLESHISYHIRFSLRAYASILYLRKFENFKIIIRGKPVQQYNIADDLKFKEVVMYKPKVGMASKEVSIKTEIGFVKEAPLLRVSGFNVYHKNRLIRPFWKVCSNGHSAGECVVGILEANFIEPAHDKQDFERSAIFLRLEIRLKQMNLDFWKSHCHMIGIGSLSRNTGTRNIQKECPTEAFDEFASNGQEFAADQPVILQQQMHLDQPVIGLAANSLGLSNEQTVLGHGSNMYKDLYSGQPVVGLAAHNQIQSNKSYEGNQINRNGQPGSSKAAPDSGSASVDEICEENIQLFLRCEAHREKETELKRSIEEMERELKETKEKCAQLARHLDSQRKQKSIRQYT